MFTNTKHWFDPKYTNHWFWGIACLALCIEFCFHALLPISISNDTYGYLSLSQNIGNPGVAFERSYGYSLLLAIIGTSYADTLIPITLLQAAMAIAIPLIIFRGLLSFGLFYAVTGALIACIYFYHFVVSLSILTELLYSLTVGIFACTLIQYFKSPSTKRALYVVAACWLIALVRVSGSLFFASFLVGVALLIVISYFNKDRANATLYVKHMGICIALFIIIALFQSAVTNRTSSIIWPHFVFNWVYRDASIGPNYYGIIKPENGPAATTLYSKLEQLVAESPSAFNTLKSGAAPEVENLQPQADGKYSQDAVEKLMDEIINNNTHSLRSWWIEGVLRNKYGTVETSKLLGNAIQEGFIKYPEVILSRLTLILKGRVWERLTNGITVNIISFPTAYYHQIPKEINAPPNAALKPNQYKQWAHDLFDHAGTSETVRKYDYQYQYPRNYKEAQINLNEDNVIGFAHYIGTQGVQILRVCWALIAIGILIWPFALHKPLLASMLSGSIVPTLASVFISETDPRHLLMTGPIQIMTAILVIYLLVDLIYKRAKRKELAHAA